MQKDRSTLDLPLRLEDGRIAPGSEDYRAKLSRSLIANLPTFCLTPLTVHYLCFHFSFDLVQKNTGKLHLSNLASVYELALHVAHEIIEPLTILLDREPCEQGCARSSDQPDVYV